MDEKNVIAVQDTFEVLRLGHGRGQRACNETGPLFGTGMGSQHRRAIVAAVRDMTARQGPGSAGRPCVFPNERFESWPDWAV